MVRFGSFELRRTERVLLSQGSPVPLGSRALSVLLALVARAGELVTKETLLDTAWPGLVVEEANVHVAVSQLRKVLGKAAIATVGGLGYRFLLPLHADSSATPGLPQPRTAFVGRQAELADAAAQLQGTRLLTRVAMGGMGKTRLAVQLAHALHGRYADGVVFVDLQPLQDGSAVPGAVARALALAAASNATAAASTAALLLHLQACRTLLVLDNCEHVLPAVQQLLAALLAQTADVSVLATSRQALELTGERVFALRPLALPAAHAQAQAALACESAQLFMQRVLAATRWALCLDTERDNLLSALAWCQQHGSAQTGLEMVAALKNFWFASGWLEPGLQAAEQALARLPADQPTLLSARVQRLAAQLCLFMSRLDEGAVHARRALAASQALADEAGAAAALRFAGRIAVKSEDTRSSEQLLREGLRRARQAQALSVVGEALNALAFAAIERDDLVAAEAHFGEALLASQQRGSALGSVIETLNLAWVCVMKAAANTRQPSELEHARQLLLSVWHTLQTMPHRYVAQELIDVCASFALRRGCSAEAALLHGASAAQRQALQLQLTAKQAARRASEAAAARAALGEQSYDQAAAAGHLLPHDQTLARVGSWLQVGPLMVEGVAAAVAPGPAHGVRPR